MEMAALKKIESERDEDTDLKDDIKNKILSMSDEQCEKLLIVWESYKNSKKETSERQKSLHKN